jgi:hypothetical protein
MNEFFDNIRGFLQLAELYVDLAEDFFEELLEENIDDLEKASNKLSEMFGLKP